MAVLMGHVLTHGPECKEFERAFAEMMGHTCAGPPAGRASAITVSSCMAALHMSCIHLGFGPGDEVLVPALTHVATAHAVEWVGARPVFVDCDPRTGNVTAELLEEAITPRTRGLLLVHFIGIPCDMKAIMDMATAKGLKVVEDCALALGTRWAGVHAGLWGDCGCFSFYPVKHITAAEGGMFVTRVAETAAAVNRLRAFGVDRTFSERSIPGQYDVTSLGLNYRMSEVQAAIGRVQLSRSGEFLKKRKDNFQLWKRALKDIDDLRILELDSEAAEQSYYCLVVVLEGSHRPHRNEIIMKLKAKGIGTSVYYPQPVPRMTYYRSKYGYDAKRYPNAEEISDASIALPLGPHIGEDQIRYMAENFLRIVREKAS